MENDFFTEREKHLKESEFLRLRKLQYEAKIKKGTFNLIINWEYNISNIDFTILKSQLESEFIKSLESDYEIKTLNLDKVLNCVDDDYEIKFPDNELWNGIRNPNNITRLLVTIENNTRIIPPILNIPFKNEMYIQDGNHRIAVCRYLKLQKIPFLIHKNQLQNIKLN